MGNDFNDIVSKNDFQGNVSRDEVGSGIMIGDMAGQAAQAGLVPFFF